MNNPIEHFLFTLRCLFIPKDKQGVHLSYKKRKARNQILSYYKENPSDDAGINAALSYLRTYGFINAYPYKFREKYCSSDIKIELDEDGDLFYTYPNGKRLYIRKMPIHVARRLMSSLLCEQDMESPHRYLSDFLQVEVGDVLLDIGCAEAFFALQFIEKLKHVYLFECDEEWIHSLQKTFAPWAEKVTIVRKYVSGIDSDTQTRLDTFFADKSDKPTFMKMDIEGAEVEVLESLGSMWKLPHLKLAVCTYHRQNDYADVVKKLKEHDFQVQRSDNYMLTSINGFVPPFFRVGVVRAKNMVKAHCASE